MASAISLFLGTGFDGTGSAKQTHPVRQATFTFEIINGNAFKT
jgi:hypothetical protein